MIQPSSSDDITIINHNFIDRLMEDIKKFDILYISAPIGWGIDALLRAVYVKMNSKDVYLLEETKEISLEEQVYNLLDNKKKSVYMIPALETIIEHEKQEILWELLEHKKSGDVFVFASAAMIPARLFPYTVLNKFISYGIEDVKPNADEVMAYMNYRGVSISNEELKRVEEDCNHMPLYIQLLVNLMINSNRGYHRGVKEQCFEDLFTYIDVTFFRAFSEEDQNALLHLSCLDEFDNKLISQMLDISRKEADAFVERVLMKSSVFVKHSEGWTFYPVMKKFLERAFYKYLDFEERQNDYKKAMKCLIGHKNWLSALRFAYALQDKRQIAECLENILNKRIDYNELLQLEVYFRELSVDDYLNHPNLLIAASLLKAIVGDTRASRRYDKLYVHAIEQEERPWMKNKMQVKLLYLYMSRPGLVREEVPENNTQLLESIDEEVLNEENYIFEPNYISVLRGEKDYCKYFQENEIEESIIEKLRDAADQMNERSFAIMLNFMEAEVLYERNELDRALDRLVKCTKEAKDNGNQRLQKLCTMAMADLLASRNQMSTTDGYKEDDFEPDEKTPTLFKENRRAHMVFYQLLKNHSEPIVHWMNEYSPDENGRFYTIHYYQYLVKAKVYIWMGQNIRARMILQLLLDFAVEYKMAYLEAQVRILEAYIYYKEDSPLWKETLLPALEWGRTLGFVRVFADEGAAIYELLNKISQDEKEWEKDEYLKKVLTAAKAQMLQYPRYLKQEQKGEIGEFSNGEKSVMSLLVLGEKNVEIAERLCISENTVKYHLKNIYQKLQVKSRSQAITKIREYKII